MIARTLKAGIAAAFVAAVLAVPASAQNSTMGVGSNFMGYTFDAGLGADAVQLFMVPVAVRFPITDAISVDLSTAWAQGEIERDKPCYIRWQSISADPARALQEVRLPDHPHMHVFAITLEAE